MSYVFGGLLTGLPTRELFGKSASWAVPWCALICMIWPSYITFNDGKATLQPAQRFRFLERFQKGSIWEVWPIQIEFLEILQQSAFWDVQVAALGSKVIAFPHIYGKRSERGGKPKFIYGEGYTKWINPKREAQPEPEAPAEASYLVKWEVEQERRIRANAIAIANRKTRKEQTAKQTEKIARVIQFRADQQAILDSALRQHDINNWATSLMIYQDLRTPFEMIAIQRNLGAWALKQAAYGPEAGERDRQLAASEFIKLEEQARS